MPKFNVPVIVQASGLISVEAASAEEAIAQVNKKLDGLTISEKIDLLEGRDYETHVANGDDPGEVSDEEWEDALDVHDEWFGDDED